jgi:hypothetical protein
MMKLIFALLLCVITIGILTEGNEEGSDQEDQPMEVGTIEGPMHPFKYVDGRRFKRQCTRKSRWPRASERVCN